VSRSIGTRICIMLNSPKTRARLCCKQSKNTKAKSGKQLAKRSANLQRPVSNLPRSKAGRSNATLCHNVVYCFASDPRSTWQWCSSDLSSYRPQQIGRICPFSMFVWICMQTGNTAKSATNFEEAQALCRLFFISSSSTWPNGRRRAGAHEKSTLSLDPENKTDVFLLGCTGKETMRRKFCGLAVCRSSLSFLFWGPGMLADYSQTPSEQVAAIFRDAWLLSTRERGCLFGLVCARTVGSLCQTVLGWERNFVHVVCVRPSLRVGKERGGGFMLQILLSIIE